jgi:hypothetical protein
MLAVMITWWERARDCLGFRDRLSRAHDSFNNFFKQHSSGGRDRAVRPPNLHITPWYSVRMTAPERFADS